MRMCPPYIRDTGSAAESRLFQILESDDSSNEWIVFHSLNLSRHKYKKWAELDFVLVGPLGVFVLEVKGGGVSCAEGVWKFTDRYGEEHRKLEGPFDQARTGMYALESLLKTSLPDSLMRRVVMGWGVVFPDVNFDMKGPEMPAEVVCDRKFFSRSQGFKGYFQRLTSFWREKHRSRARPELCATDIKQICTYLRPEFDVLPSLASRADEVEREVVSLTNEQYRYLDAIDSAPRILCEGGAGTGKTFLAAEVARREAAQGRRVLLAARGDVFAAYLSSKLCSPNITVLSGRELERLARTSRQQAVNEYDVLIVDEGQDLMTLSHIEIFDLVLTGGVDGGHWRWFYDGNAQSAIYGVWEDDAHQYLLSSGAVPMELKYNCRNTEDIIFQTQQVTGAHLGKTEVKGRGLPVVFKVVNDSEDAIDALSAQLEDWMEQDIRLGEVAILSPYEFYDSCVSGMSSRWLKKLIRCDDAMFDTNRDKDFMLFSTIKDYKGLERRFIALVDTGDLSDDDKSVSLLYVGMTRAHAGLWVAVDRKFQRTFDQLRKTNAMEMLRMDGV